jgi:hypothetical protein
MQDRESNKANFLKASEGPSDVIMKSVVTVIQLTCGRAMAAPARGVTLPL